MTFSRQSLSLLVGASVAALVAGTAQATPYRLETHGYLDHGKLVVTSTKVTDVSGHGRKTKPVYTTYSATYTAAVTAPLKVASVVASVGYFTNTSAGACIGYPAGKFKLAVASDLNGSWKATNLPAATIPYTGTAVTCTGGTISNFLASETTYTWKNKAGVAGTTADASTAVYTLKALDLGSTTEGFIVIDTYDEAVTYCGVPAKGTTVCP